MRRSGDRLRVTTQLVDVGACLGAGDPAAAAVGGGRPAVEARGVLPGDERPPGALAVQPRGERAVSDLVLEQTCDDLDARVPQRLHSAMGEVGRLGARDHHLSDAGVEQGLRTRSRAPDVVAGLQGDNGRTAPARGLLERDDLSVRAARRQGGAFADDLAVLVEDNRADGRVGAGGAQDGARELERPAHRLLEVHFSPVSPWSATLKCRDRSRGPLARQSR